MSPSYAYGIRSPNQILDEWFKGYFKWYSPEITKTLTTDLRPDFGSLYVYGCRAYPLKTEKAAGKEKRASKVSPRAHIGHLVGYDASNLCRIWIPQLKRVVSTRNVRFNKKLLYNKPKKKEKALPVGISKELTELMHELPRTYALDRMVKAFDA